MRSIFQDLIPRVAVGFSRHRLTGDDHNFPVLINFDPCNLKPACPCTIEGTFDAAFDARTSTHDNTHHLIWPVLPFGVPMSSASNTPH